MYNALLEKLQAAESKNYGPRIEAEKFEAKIKERDDKISELRIQLLETKAALENAKSSAAPLSGLGTFDSIISSVKDSLSLPSNHSFGK